MPTSSSSSPTSPPLCHILIAAGGNGERAGTDLPKQYSIIQEKTVLRHTIDAFLKVVPAQFITVIIHPDHQDLYDQSVADIQDICPVAFGGNSRKDSVHNGLKSLSKASHINHDTPILIHDAARPFIHPDDIHAVLAALKNNKAATLCRPVTDTLRHKNTGENVDRSALYAMQTPQGFHYGTAMDMHDRQTAPNVTDDIELAMQMGVEVDFIEAHHMNTKITYPADLDMAQKILSAPSGSALTIRTGLGYDVHAFDDGSAQSIRLGGINVPHDRKLKGHSDADVVLHAITDAILGAMALGDIGDHFPPSDNNYKDMDSAVFLEKARDLVLAKNGHIQNIDVTVICEAPKLMNYKKPMQSRIAKILKISDDQVSVKATTSERLGFTGRKEGIAAQAVVTIGVSAS